MKHIKKINELSITTLSTRYSFAEIEKELGIEKANEVKTYRDNNNNKHRDSINESMRNNQRKKRKGIIGQAQKRVDNYIRLDRMNHRGECSITTDDVIKYCLSDGCMCVYCGSTERLGFDRVDNSKPHTIDNVVPCCPSCNNKRHTKDFNVFYENNLLLNLI